MIGVMNARSESAMHHRGSPVVVHDDEAGASLLEYGLLMALIAVVAFSAVSYFGTASKDLMQYNADCIDEAVAGQTPDCS